MVRLARHIFHCVPCYGFIPLCPLSSCGLRRGQIGMVRQCRRLIYHYRPKSEYFGLLVPTWNMTPPKMTQIGDFPKIIPSKNQAHHILDQWMNMNKALCKIAAAQRLSRIAEPCTAVRSRTIAHLADCTVAVLVRCTAVPKDLCCASRSPLLP